MSPVDCERIDLLIGLTEDALEPDERTAVEGHLDGCASCREVVAGYRETAVALRGLEAPAPSPEATERAYAAVLAAMAADDAAAAPEETPGEAETAGAAEASAGRRPAGRLIPFFRVIAAAACLMLVLMLVADERSRSTVADTRKVEPAPELLATPSPAAEKVSQAQAKRAGPTERGQPTSHATDPSPGADLRRSNAELEERLLTKKQAGHRSEAAKEADATQALAAKAPPAKPAPGAPPARADAKAFAAEPKAKKRAKNLEPAAPAPESFGGPRPAGRNLRRGRRPANRPRGAPGKKGLAGPQAAPPKADGAKADRVAGEAKRKLGRRGFAEGGKASARFKDTLRLDAEEQRAVAARRAWVVKSGGRSRLYAFDGRRLTTRELQTVRRRTRATAGGSEGEEAKAAPVPKRSWGRMTKLLEARSRQVETRRDRAALVAILRGELRGRWTGDPVVELYRETRRGAGGHGVARSPKRPAPKPTALGKGRKLGSSDGADRPGAPPADAGDDDLGKREEPAPEARARLRALFRALGVEVPADATRAQLLAALKRLEAPQAATKSKKP